MSVVLTIVVVEASEPIRGTIASAGGAVQRPFRGWLDLAAAMEAMLAAHAGAADQEMGS